MRKLALCLVVLSLSLPLWAQSVVISQEKLDELTAILQQYSALTQALKTSLDSSTASINALQLGFTQYKQEVDQVLLPKAKAQESDIFWLKVGLIAVGVVAGIEAVDIGGHAAHLW